MVGLFAKPRVMATVVAVSFLVAAAALAAIYFLKPHATLRITIGPEGSQSHRFISAFIKVTEAQHPRIPLYFRHSAERWRLVADRSRRHV